MKNVWESLSFELSVTDASIVFALPNRQEHIVSVALYELECVGNPQLSCTRGVIVASFRI